MEENLPEEVSINNQDDNQRESKKDIIEVEGVIKEARPNACLLYTSDAADE